MRFNFVKIVQRGSHSVSDFHHGFGAVRSFAGGVHFSFLLEEGVQLNNSSYTKSTAFPPIDDFLFDSQLYVLFYCNYHQPTNQLATQATQEH